MKILAVCQYYFPEPFRINDICEALAGLGHEVTVVTGTPNYPEGKIYPGYEGGKRADETLNGVRVRRCRVTPRGDGSLRRLANYFSFPREAGKYVRSGKCASADGSPFDVVFINQLSPVMMAEPGLRYAGDHGVPAVLYCLDLWPESVVAGGRKRGGAAYRFFDRVSEKIYRSADRILVSSEAFGPYLADRFGVGAERISYLPQYAEDLFGASGVEKTGGPAVLTFAGNVGTAQDVGTIISAAELTRDTGAVYRICGGGTELGRMKELASGKGLANVVFTGRLPLEEMPGIYAGSDAMIITMEDDAALSMTLPGKLQSYMAAGRPVIGAINGEAARVISEAGCGFVSPAGDAAALSGNVRRFAALGEDEKREMGRRAREYYEKHFDKGIFMERLTAELEAAVRSGK